MKDKFPKVIQLSVLFKLFKMNQIFRSFWVSTRSRLKILMLNIKAPLMNSDLYNKIKATTKLNTYLKCKEVKLHHQPTHTVSRAAIIWLVPRVAKLQLKTMMSSFRIFSNE